MPIRTLVLDEQKVKEGKLEDLKSPKIVWVNVEKPTASELSSISEFVGMSPEEMRQWLKSRQRPVVFNIEKHSVIVFHMPVFNGGNTISEPILFFISKTRNNLISIHAHQSRAIDKVYAYTQAHSKDVFQHGTTHILFTLLDEIIDSFFIQLDQLNDLIDAIERRMFDYKQSDTVMRHTFNVKKNLLFIHKALVGNREVLHSIEKRYAQFVNQNHLEEFRELHGNITQLLEMTTTYHDIITTSVEIHLSAISNNLNTTMKRVTSWGAIILVPSLIASIFGMNFQNEPLLASSFGFIISLVSMVLSVCLLALYFKRRGWL